MTTRQQAAVQAWADGWNAHDAERLVACLTPDASYEDVAFGVVNHGPAEARQFIEGFLAACPDLQVEATVFASAGDQVAAEWTLSGTQQGDFPDLPATGKPFRVRGVSLLELAGEKVRYLRDYWDFATFLRQVSDPSAAPTR